MSTDTTDLAFAEYKGILCIQERCAYETEHMASFRAWLLACNIDVARNTSKRDIKKKAVTSIANAAHLASCAAFLGCEYDQDLSTLVDPTIINHTRRHGQTTLPGTG